MNTADATFQELEGILSKECEAHERMLHAATLVNSAIKESNLETLEKNTAYLDGETHQIERLEEQRKACCGALARALGLGRMQIRLAALIEKAPPERTARLSAMHAMLRSALEKISRVTVSNRVLLEEGMRLVQSRFALMAQPGVRFARYGERGGRATSELPLHPFINQTA